MARTVIYHSSHGRSVEECQHIVEVLNQMMPHARLSCDPEEDGKNATFSCDTLDPFMQQQVVMLLRDMLAPHRKVA